MMRQATTYNKLVARRDNEFLFCDDIFDYGDNGLKGATGTVLRPVPKDEYEERTSEQGLVDYLGELWQGTVQAGDTKMGKAEWCQYVYDSDGDDVLYDFSGSNLWEQLRAIGYSEDEYPVIECIGGGRCFSSDDTSYDEVYDDALLEKIRGIEQRVTQVGD